MSGSLRTRIRGRFSNRARLAENTFVVCMLASYDIHNRVLYTLDLGDIRSYSSTCTTIYDEVQAYYQRMWSIDSILERFIPSQHIPSFRRLQAKTGLVISGSAALQFFTNVHYPSSDLDLYVNCYNAREVGEWLEDIGCTTLDAAPNRGEPTWFEERIAPLIDADPSLFVKPPMAPPGNYIVEESKPPLGATDYSWLGMHAVISFDSPVNSTTIQLILAARNILCVVLNFHSTVVANLITASRAYSLYGEETLSKGLSLVLCTRWSPSPINEAAKTIAARKKYTNRGWTMVPGRADALALRSFRPGRRRVGDKKSWIVDLPPIEGYEDEYFRDPIENNAWTLEYNASDGMARMRYELVYEGGRVLMRLPSRPSA